ncbi:MAG: OPT/YSL family transporter [Sphaerochaetaceae bacterium]
MDPDNSDITPKITSRSLIIGTLGLLIITASSAYVALRMGALPWPTVFVTVVSMTILRRFKDSTLQEINVTHTMMSAGAMVSGGLAFTLPGIWMLNPQTQVSTTSLLVLTLCGAILGTLFSIIARKKYIERDRLPYPMGQAAYQTLIAGTTQGKGARWLFISLIACAVFTVFRDGIPLIPAVLVLFAGDTLIPAISIWVSPMAAGIGAIIGPVLSLVWLGGAVLGYLLITPVGIATGFFGDMTAANLFRQNLGIGLMVGTGLGIFIKAILDRVELYRKAKKAEGTTQLPASALLTGKARWAFFGLVALVTMVLAIGTEITLLQAVVTVVGIYLTTQLAAMLTGQTGINPMEIFGILVLLAVQLIWSPSVIASFSIAAVTAVACGLSGDMMNDLKSGYLLGTRPSAQFLVEGIGGVIGSVVAVTVLLVLKDSFGGFGSEYLPAPQAKAVTAMIGGLGHVPAFIAGAAIGIILYLLRIPAATLGLGVYLPISISSIMGFGALAFIAIKKVAGKPLKHVVTERTGLIASGFLGGEGITGVILAIISMF